MEIIPDDEMVSEPGSQTQTQTQDTDYMTQSQHTQSQQTQEEVKPWGKLTPSERCPQFPTLKLFKEVYKAGKLPDHDIIFDIQNLKEEAIKVISKHHFSISKEVVNSKNDFVAVLSDHSRNGTFVNRKRVGLNNRVVLENGDKIAIGRAGFTDKDPDFAAVFEFDGLNYSNKDLPRELSTSYTVLKKLGAGAAGEVHLVFSKSCFRTFAIKSISKARSSIYTSQNPLHDPKKIQREVDILQKLQHPCIIRMENIIDTPMKVFIVLELMEGGELFDRISNNNGLPEKVTKFMFWQICDAVSYLHSRGITHRDLKPENILLSSDETYPLVKVSDFGMSKFLDAASMLKTYCGTPLYVAPEILKRRGRGAYTAQVDVWSLGVILYVMLSGLCPFSQNHEMPLDEQILRGVYRFPKPKFDAVSLDAIDLIRSMLTVNAARRRTIKQVLEHRWLTTDWKIKNEVNKILKIPNENAPPNDGNVQVEHNTEHVFDAPASIPKRARLG